MIKFVYICFCFISSVFFILKSWNRKDGVVLASALFFTAMSDFFLIMLENYPMGVTSFCIVHILYTFRYRGTFPIKKISLYGVVALVTGILTGQYIIGIAIFYALLFQLSLVSVYQAFHEKRFPKWNSYCMAIGMVLFALCDICVLLFNLPTVFSFGETMAQTIYPFIWLFYTPSQFLLAVSSLDFERLKM